jgi:hypothetical protein
VRIIPLHIVIFKEIIKIFWGEYFVRNSAVKPFNCGEMAIVNHALLYSEKIMEKIARP